tara:strand:- start:27 stop:248 length:222 start_codon:yes stop_codon:yes gene_type:complete
MKTIRADYFAEAADEKTAGSIIIRKDCVVSVYTLPGYSKRSMILTEQGLKFCLRGKPQDFLGTTDEDLLTEAI